MHNQNPWNSYRKIATQTAPPGQLVLMLYDGAIRFLRLAMDGFSKQDIAEANERINNNIVRAQEIIHELNFSLNVDQGGDLGMHLRRLYHYFDRRLLDSNLNKEPSGVQEVLDRLLVLREAWAAMLRGETLAPAASVSERAELAVA